MNKDKIKDYPVWICSECGHKYGHHSGRVCSWHPDTCDICGEERSCTEPRDFGHLKPGWEKANRK